MPRRALDSLCSAATRPRILVAGWLLFLVYAYPGYMSTDSVVQLLQARSGDFHDWYPPLMAFLWRQTDRVIAGPFPMLAIQSVLFLVGLERTLSRVISERAAALAAVCILLFPPVLTTMAVIWKDSQMAAFLLAGIGALSSPSRRWRCVGLGLMFLAAAQRYNALAATLPPIALLFVWTCGGSRWKRYGIAIAAWVAATGLAFGTNSLLTDHHDHPWHTSVALFDIAGTLGGAGRMPDAKAEAVLAGVPLAIHDHLAKQIKAAYSPVQWWYLEHGAARPFDPPTTAAQRSAVARAWWNLVTSHPWAYLVHRWRVFREVLGMSEAVPFSAVWTAFTGNDAQAAMIGHRATHSALQRAWVDAMTWMDASLVFRAHLYLLLGLALLPFCRRQRLAFVVLASGLANELGLFFAAPSADFRYSHWMIVCTIAAVVMLFAARRRTALSTASAPR